MPWYVAWPLLIAFGALALQFVAVRSVYFPVKHPEGFWSLQADRKSVGEGKRGDLGGRRHTRCLSDWSSDVCSSDLSSPSVRWPCNSWRFVPCIFQSSTRKGFGAYRLNSAQPTSRSTRRTVSVSMAGLSPVLGAAASPSSCTATPATSRIAVSASVRSRLPAPLF